MSAPLYNREILALAVALGDYPRLPDPPLSGDRRAPLCGSRVLLDLSLDTAGRIAAAGLAVEACALGQASATLFARAAPGLDARAVLEAHRALADWLGGAGDIPHWPGLGVLEPARAYPARHGAILLPFALAADLMRDTMQEAAA